MYSGFRGCHLTSTLLSLLPFDATFSPAERYAAFAPGLQIKFAARGDSPFEQIVPFLTSKNEA
jgi:hypothetical protein